MSLIPLNTTLERHLQTCNEVYRLIAEENRLLKVEQRVPGAQLLEEKQKLLGRLDEEIAAIRIWEPETDARVDGALVERVRSRILQILHLDRENEQLLLRYSMGAPAQRTRVAAPTPSQLRGLYRAS